MSKLIPLTLHSYRRCPFAIRVRMTLEEKGLPYQIIEESLSARSPELLRLHPEGKVPLLIHDGLAIHESAIITEYLEDLVPTPSLRPESPQEIASLRMWTLWCDRSFKPDLDQFKYKWPELSDQERSSLVVRLQQHLTKLYSVLAERSFLMGPDLTLADIHIFPFYRQLQKSNSDFHKLFQIGKLDDWLERIIQRPSFARAMKKP